MKNDTQSPNPITPSSHRSTHPTTHIEEKKENITMSPEQTDLEKKDLEQKKAEQEKKEEHMEPTRLLDALASVEGEMAALDARDLATINVDISLATITALGCMPELRGLRDALFAKFGTETAGLVEQLDVRARAANQANVDYYATAQSVDHLGDKSKRVIETRGVLHAVAQLLVQRKLLAAEPLENLRGTGSHRNQAHDLQLLVSVLRRATASMAGVVTVSSDELDAAEDAAKDLLIAIGVREQAPPLVNAAADKRHRAFTLFVRTYDELRSAISHLRWREKDVDTILPSLYAGRGGRKKEEDVAPPVVVSPAPSTEVVSPSPVVANGESKPPVRPGMPGAEPFAPV